MRKYLIATALGAALIAGPVALSDSLFAPVNAVSQSSALTLDKSRGVLTMSPLLEEVTPAVVSIQTEGKSVPRQAEADEFFERFFGRPMPEGRDRSKSAIGSGVIVDAANGYVLTNHHVVADAEDITVTLKDKREIIAEFLGGDEKTDIAVLKIDAANLGELKFAPENGTKVGDYVIAIGNAFGLEHTVTSGIVSATGRYMPGSENLQDMIQTDASINPGNSGGALINSKGELIGINSMIISRSGGNNGIGFAVPIKIAKNVMNQLVAFGEVRRGRIGVTIRDIDPALQEAMGLGTLNGALVNDVSEDSPAEKAGLEPGDIIIGFNGDDIMNSNDIRNAVGLVQPGKRVDLTYLRDDRRRTTRITVETQDDAAEISDKPSDTKTPAMESFSGAKLTNIPADMDLRDGNDGVLVTEIDRGSKASRAGLRKGDIIRKISNTKIADLAAFKDYLADNDGPYALSVERQGTNLFLAVR